MNANARKVHGMGVIIGVACAVAAALPCAAGESATVLDTVTVQDSRVAPNSSSPGDKDKDKDKDKKKGKSAPAEENIGFFGGLALGAVAGGPIGAVAGGITGALLGDHYHQQKIANRELAMRLHDLTVNIAFRTGDAHLTSADVDQLTTLGQLAGGMPGVTLEVSGHADPRGAADYNKSLSRDRAESVAAVLENSGLAKDRIVIEALGASGAGNTGNLDDYAFQRRVSVKLVGGSAVAARAASAAVTVASAQ